MLLCSLVEVKAWVDSVDEFCKAQGLEAIPIEDPSSNIPQFNVMLNGVEVALVSTPMGVMACSLDAVS